MLRLLIRLLSLLSLGSLYKIADWLVFPFLYHICRYRRTVAYRNIGIAFPEWTEKQRQDLEKQSYKQLCSVLAESVYAWRATPEAIHQRARFDASLQIVFSEFEKHNMAIAQLSHLGCWEWLSNVAHRFNQIGVRMLVVYRPVRNDKTNRLLCEFREKRGCEVVRERQVLRRLIEAKQNNEKILLAMLSDQRPAPKTGRAKVDFFGMRMDFINGAEVLARKFHCSVFGLQVSSPQRGVYDVAIQRLKEADDDTQQGIITQRYAYLLEKNIKNRPALWLWTHNRFRDLGKTTN